jgi:type IV pilus assembly protein PilX
MTPPRPFHPAFRALRRAPRAAQRGASLLFALAALVALTFAAAALLRTVDTGALIVGNLGFKDDTLLASDEATRMAMQYVQNGGSTGAVDLGTDITAQGYYQRATTYLDVTGNSKVATRAIVDWKLDNCVEAKSGTYATCVKPVATKIDLPNGVWARYIVVRLCTASSTPASLDCLGPTSTSSLDTLDSGELKYVETKYAKSKGQQFYYRVVVRTEGARGAVTFTEAIAHNYAGE